MDVKSFPHANQVDFTDTQTDVIILFPVSQYEEGHSIATHDAPKDCILLRDIVIDFSQNRHFTGFRIR